MKIRRLTGAILVCGVFWVSQSCSSCSSHNENHSEETLGLTVSHPVARSCDVLLTSSEGAARFEVEFSESVKGQVSERAPKLTVSFINRLDEAFDGAVATFETSSVDISQNKSLSVEKAKCFDEDGHPVEKPGVELR